MDHGLGYKHQWGMCDISADARTWRNLELVLELLHGPVKLAD